MGLNKFTFSFFTLVVLMFFSCNKSEKPEIELMSIGVGPFEIQIVEFSKDSVYYTRNEIFEDKSEYWEYARRAKMEKEELNRLVGIIFQSGILEEGRQNPGNHFVGENILCLEIVYSDGSVNKYEKLNLSSDEYQIIKDLLQYTSPGESTTERFNFRISDCVGKNIPSEIQFPDKILVPEDIDSL